MNVWFVLRWPYTVDGDDKIQELSHPKLTEYAMLSGILEFEGSNCYSLFSVDYSTNGEYVCMDKSTRNSPAKILIIVPSKWLFLFLCCLYLPVVFVCLLFVSSWGDLCGWHEVEIQGPVTDLIAVCCWLFDSYDSFNLTFSFCKKKKIKSFSSRRRSKKSVCALSRPSEV